MIVPMQKVAVLCAAGDRDAAVRRLYELGVVHLRGGGEVQDGDLDQARQRLARLHEAVQLLAARPAGDDRSAAAAPGRAAAAVADELLQLAAEQAECQRALAALQLERTAVLPFGDFDPAAVPALRQAGVVVELIRYPEHTRVELAPGASLHPLSVRDGQAAAAIVAPARPAAAEPLSSVRPLPLPERGLRAIDAAIAARQARVAAIDARFAAAAAELPRLRAAVVEATMTTELLAARAQMEGAQAVAWLSGFCPAHLVPRLQQHARDAAMVVVARPTDPDDQVPTLLGGPKWVRQVHAVFEGIGICPGYGEADVSAVFLLFLMLFAAMLIGDAGYGALLLALSVWLWRRTGRAPGGPPQAVRLLASTSVATIGWGAITGTWFAIPSLPAALATLRIDWLAGPDQLATTRHVMLLCFLLGAIHLTVAHLWAALRSGLGLPALAQLGWIASTWLMFCLANTMVLGAEFPAPMTTVAIVGVALIVLFMTPVRQLKSEWFNHVMLPLSLVSNFVDVVSYLRLFAVGTAGVAVASSFNDMAARAAHEGGSGWLIAVFVALFGHTLNLLLCAMGVLVHGVRLNTLEFSAHLGIQWSGVAYRPFGRRGAATGAEGADP